MRTDFFARAFITAMAVAMATTPGAAQGALQNSPPTRPIGGATTTAKGPTISQRDTVRIEVLGEAHDKFSVVVTVGIDGCIEYPTAGRIKVEGMTTDELRIDIQRRLSEQLNDPQVAVQLEATKNKSVYVSGEVRSVGIVPYAGSLTAREALILAGSVTEQAAAEATIVRRDSPQNLTIDLVGLMSGNPNTPNPELQDGDTILVQKATPVFVQGFVNTPGPYVVRPGTTVQQIIVMAGGVSEKGKETGIKIQRPNADPKRKPTEIPVKDWKTEVVKPGDTVIVPKRLW